MKLTEAWLRHERRNPMKLIIILLPLALTACAGTPVVTAMPNSCATLLPQEWKQGVAGAPLPDGDTVGDWIAFGDQQTGKLDIANDRTKSAIGIVERCEARDAAAVKRASRGFFGRLFG
jgi:hypothetical protein